MGIIIKIETSARHIHLSEKDFQTLFGSSAKLTVKKMLSLPGLFAAEERLTVVGPKGKLENLAIIGPFREQTQVELSFTDSRIIGVCPPIRESGDLKNSEKCEIIGPCGTVNLNSGVIIAKRHVHFSVDDAEKCGVNNKDIIKIRIKTPDRTTIFNDVIARVAYNFVTTMHIDTDECNAAGCIGNNIAGEIYNN